jgi:hypothetical protein
MNWHQAIIPLENVLSSKKKFGNNTLPMSRVYLYSQVFTIMICLEQDSLSQRINCTIENYYFYST